TFTYGSAKAKNVDIEMTITVTSTFSGEVITPDWLPNVNVSGTIDFDPFTQSNSLGDIDMDGGSFTMKANAMSFGPFSMKPDPIGNGAKTTVAEMNAKDIEMHGTIIPLQNPLGITFGDSFPVPNPMGPMNIKVKKVCMDELDSTKVTTPPATVRNVVAQKINIPTVTTEPLEVDSNTPIGPISMTKDLWDNGAHPTGDATNQKITTTVTLNVSGVKLKIKGGLEFSDVEGSVAVSSASSTPFDLNLAFKGLKIVDLKMKSLTLPELEVEF
ncbi:MAG: hypothetical protein OK454_08615, partial [Thaumarchaeota archaeon]|nr:hypothetical protein [Nitrososphaerota archaeon]